MMVGSSLARVRLRMGTAWRFGAHLRKAILMHSRTRFIACGSLAFALVLGTFSGPLSGTAKAANAGPVHWWTLNETNGTASTDTGSPGSADGTLGSAVTHITGGEAAGALHFPGGSLNSIVTLGSPGTVGTADFTATFWIRTAMTTNAELLGNRSCGSACNFWGLRGNGTSVSFELYQDADGTNGGGVTVTATVNDGLWHYVAARRSGKNITLFVDGVSKSATVADVTNISTGTPLSFGANPTSVPFGTYYVGDADEIRLYDRALADCEIAGSPVMTTPTLCAPSSACHAGGTCNVLTGACTDPLSGDGSTCDDGNACTHNDSCAAGACAGTAIVCTAKDECHTAGSCTAGVCSDPLMTDGSACTGRQLQGRCVQASDSTGAGRCAGRGRRGRRGRRGNWYRRRRREHRQRRRNQHDWRQLR